MGLAAAVAGAAVIGAGASIYSSSTAASAASDAAAKNNALQTSIYNQNSANLTPYIQNGTAASNEYSGLLGLGGNSSASNAAYDTWKNATGYQSALKQGQDSVTAALGAKGLTDSGAALKSLTQYGQNYASNNLQTYLGNVGTLSGQGESAASALAGTGQNYANSVSSNNNTAASATGNASLSSSNSINSLLGNLTGAAALGSSYGSANSSLSAANANLNSAIGGNAMSDIGSSMWSV